MKYTDDYLKDIGRVVDIIPNIERLKDSKVFITGASGLIGSSVGDILLFLNKIKAYNIKVIFGGRCSEKLSQRFDKYILGEDYTYLYYNALKPDLNINKVDYIINCAANADPASFSKMPVETIIGIFEGTKCLLEFARNKEVKRILHVSSSEVYGIKEGRSPYTEVDYGYVDILNPRACYPSSKRLSESLCSSYFEEYGVDFVIVRPGHIYGPSVTATDSRASSCFSREAAAGKNIVMKSTGMQIRSYCYSLDCASAILTVLINGKSGEAYNISNKDSVVTIREMAKAFAEAGNVDVVFENPSDMELKGFNLMSNSSLDSEKLELLGWKALYSMKIGAVKTLLSL